MNLLTKNNSYFRPCSKRCEATFRRCLWATKKKKATKLSKHIVCVVVLAKDLIFVKAD